MPDHGRLRNGRWQTVTVVVKGDKKIEGQEVFYVNLSGAAGAFIVSGQGSGVVKNDDR